MRYCPVCGAAFRSSRTCPRDGVALEAGTFDPFVGRVLGGRYRVLERIGSGGMGQVYRAAHTRIACAFAVKVIWGDVAYDPSVQARFTREAEVASCLQSRYIVRVVDFAIDEGSAPYLVMELLDGPTLHDVMQREGRLPATRAARIAQRIALGLAHAHDRGVVHRDLKPENVVLLREDDEPDVVKLLDFGVAGLADAERLTGTGMAVGTPLYMAPEQVRGHTVDGRADLYALGVLLVEMLTGKPPFDAPLLQDLLRAHVSTPAPSLRGFLEATGAPRGLDDVVQRLLAKSADDRPGSAREAVAAIAAAMRIEGPARGAAPIAPAPPPPSLPGASHASWSPAPPGVAAPTSGAPSTPWPGTAPASAAAPSTSSAGGVPQAVVFALGRAILAGAPRYNAGDHAGCVAIYRAEAERLSADPAVPGAVADHLRAATARAAARASATDAAWDLRHAFDAIMAHGALAADRPPAPEASPASLDRSPPAAAAPTRLAAAAVRADVRERLVGAIRLGAPAYNEGDHERCARLYHDAAGAIVLLAASDPGAEPIEQHLRRALREAEGRPPADAAWVLRRAFDAVLSLA